MTDLIINTLTEETEFFDWLRDQQDSKKLTQQMVDGAHEMMATMSIDKLRAALMKINGWDHRPALVMNISAEGSAKLKEYEKFVSHPYLDQANKWTIGYGNTYYENRQPVKPTDKHITEKRAVELKRNIINMDFAPAVNLTFADLIAEGGMTQNMFDALILLSYNIGTRGLAGSNVAKQLKAGNKKAAADAFLPWNKVRKNGRLEVSNGLVNRRAKERALFLA